MVYHDQDNRFVEHFDPNTGAYSRTGILDEKGKDTGCDPFMRDFPNLLDIGIMNTCVCAGKCRVDCYQKASERHGPNMIAADYESIMKQCAGRVFEVALGGAGDPDTHEDFERILQLTRAYGIVPNFTTSGILMSPEKANLCSRYCGAVAVSEHHADYTENAIRMLLDAGCKTNLHFVLGKHTIDEAIRRLQTNDFYSGINAVVFLLYKPVGFGKQENVLCTDDTRLRTFFELIDSKNFPFRVGFDSCTTPGIFHFTKNVVPESIDTCEGGRFSAYITPDMKMLPCSFDNQALRYAVDLRTHTIEAAWYGDEFEEFRDHLRYSCLGCKNKSLCMGGCPLVPEIVLCNDEERHYDMV